jgi:hypothetical protein
MSMLLKKLLHPYLMAPADDGGSGGGAVDRGDDFTPTEDDDTPDPQKAEATDEDKKKVGVSDELDEEEEPKSEEEEEQKDEKKDKKKDSRMPLARHKEILERERAQRKALEDELARFKQGDKIAATNEEITKAENNLLALEKEYHKLIADGESDKAVDKMGEIRRLERAIQDKRTEMLTQAAETRAAERVRYDLTLERLEEAYPTINEDSDDFDQGVADEVIDVKLAFQARGYPASQALQRAVKYVLGEPKNRAQERAVNSEARVDKEDVAKKVAEERAAAARKKAADTAGKQPPSTAKIGQDSDKSGGGINARDVMKMSQDDFSKLDEATLAKLRGDELV